MAKKEWACGWFQHGILTPTVGCRPVASKIRREDPAEIYEVCEALGASLRGFWGFGRILSLGLVEPKNRGKPRRWELAKVPVIEHSQLRAAMVAGSRDRGETVQKLP
jgi:hypothetical protein